MPDRHTDPRIRFLLPTAGVRGVSVRLDQAWGEIQAHVDNPPVARELLGQACAAAALFTGHAKVNGRLSLQLRSGGALRTLFAECTAQDTVRGIAQLREGSDAPADLRDLGADAVLAITIENPGLDPREPQRYQSLVPLEQAALGPALQDYFIRSEQLPTRLLLAAGAKSAAGMMLQKLPGDEGDSDGWNRACALFDTLRTDELLHTDSDQLLYRLFHEEGVEVLARQELRFGCSCSRDRVAAMLESLGREEAAAAASEGQAEVHCEFCGQRYLFSREEIAELFTLPPVGIPAPERLQ